MGVRQIGVTLTQVQIFYSLKGHFHFIVPKVVPWLTFLSGHIYVICYVPGAPW